MNCINLFHGVEKWQAFMKMMVNIHVLYNTRDFFFYLRTCKFYEKACQYGISYLVPQ